jgi:hypothetical protein
MSQGGFISLFSDKVLRRPKPVRPTPNIGGGSRRGLPRHVRDGPGSAHPL